MIEVVRQARSQLAAAAEDVDVDMLAPAAAVDLWVALAELERLVAGLRLVVTRKASAASTWRDEGCRSFEEWSALRLGQSRADAVRDVKVANQLDFLPDAEEALRRGEVTPRQAEQVTQAADADPAAGKAVLSQARQGRPMRELRRAADRAKAAAASRQSEEQRTRRWRQARDVRFWVGGDGLAHLDAAGPLAELAAVKAAMEARADQLFAAASQAGEPADPRHLRFDALVELVTEQRDGRGADPSAPHWTINLFADVSSFSTGATGHGEVCEIPGVGFVPAAVARAVLGDAFVNLILTDGCDVRTVASAGRHIPRRLKTALLARDRGCVVCGSPFNLEYDHWRRDYAQRGLTCLSNLVTLCRRHHRMRHYDGWTLDGSPGHWTWSPPGTGGPAEAPGSRSTTAPATSAAGRPRSTTPSGPGTPSGPVIPSGPSGPGTPSGPSGPGTPSGPAG